MNTNRYVFFYLYSCIYFSSYFVICEIGRRRNHVIPLTGSGIVVGSEIHNSEFSNRQNNVTVHITERPQFGTETVGILDSVIGLDTVTKADRSIRPNAAASTNVQGTVARRVSQTTNFQMRSQDTRGMPNLRNLALGQEMLGSVRKEFQPNANDHNPNLRTPVIHPEVPPRNIVQSDPQKGRLLRMPDSSPESGRRVSQARRTDDSSQQITVSVCTSPRSVRCFSVARRKRHRTVFRCDGNCPGRTCIIPCYCSCTDQIEMLEALRIGVIGSVELRTIDPRLTRASRAETHTRETLSSEQNQDRIDVINHMTQPAADLIESADSFSNITRSDLSHFGSSEDILNNLTRSQSINQSIAGEEPTSQWQTIFAQPVPQVVVQNSGSRYPNSQTFETIDATTSSIQQERALPDVVTIHLGQTIPNRDTIQQGRIMPNVITLQRERVMRNFVTLQPKVPSHINNRMLRRKMHQESNSRIRIPPRSLRLDTNTNSPQEKPAPRKGQQVPRIPGSGIGNIFPIYFRNALVENTVSVQERPGSRTGPRYFTGGG